MSRLRRRPRVLTRYEQLMGKEGLMAALLKDARAQGRAEAAVEIIEGMHQARGATVVRFPHSVLPGAELDEQLVEHLAIAVRAGRLSLSQIPDIRDAT